MMTEEITNYIISIAPSIGAIATVLVAGVKVIKSFGSNFDALKKEVGGKVVNLEKNVSTLTQQNLTLREDNAKLLKEVNDLLDEVKKSNKVNENIQALSKEIASTNDNIANMVNDKLNQELCVIEQIKADKKMIGE